LYRRLHVRRGYSHLDAGIREYMPEKCKRATRVVRRRHDDHAAKSGIAGKCHGGSRFAVRPGPQDWQNAHARFGHPHVSQAIDTMSTVMTVESARDGRIGENHQRVWMLGCQSGCDGQPLPFVAAKRDDGVGPFQRLLDDERRSRQ
jgi:hypothetical protein